MFECPQCGNHTCKYLDIKKAFKCLSCGFEEKVKPKQKNCIYCGAPYTYYNWNDPSGCKQCYRSFVE